MSRYLKQDGNLIPLEKYNADNGLSTTSENAVQNKVITQEILDTKADIESGLSGKSGRFEIVNIQYTNTASVSIAGGKEALVSLSTPTPPTSDMIALGVTYVNSSHNALMPRLWNTSSMYLRNVSSSAVTVPANGAIVASKWLRWL